MPEVTIEVAGRSYRVGCGEGEESHLTSLAEHLDLEAAKLTRQLGQMPEGRLMLMTALMLADQLAEAHSRLADAENRADEVPAAVATHTEVSDTLSPERELQIAASLDQLSARIESLVGRIEGQG